MAVAAGTYDVSVRVASPYTGKSLHVQIGGAGAGLDPASADPDSDGVPDPFSDPDSDGATNLDEFLAGTDPLVASDILARAAGGGRSARTGAGAQAAPAPLAIAAASCRQLWSRRRVVPAARCRRLVS